MVGFPNNYWGFPTKNDHFGVEIGEPHHFRKQPHGQVMLHWLGFSASHMAPQLASQVLIGGYDGWFFEIPIRRSGKWKWYNIYIYIYLFDIWHEIYGTSFRCLILFLIWDFNHVWIQIDESIRWVTMVLAPSTLRSFVVACDRKFSLRWRHLVTIYDKASVFEGSIKDCLCQKCAMKGCLCELG